LKVTSLDPGINTHESHCSTCPDRGKTAYLLCGFGTSNSLLGDTLNWYYLHFITVNWNRQIFSLLALIFWNPDAVRTCARLMHQAFVTTCDQSAFNNCRIFWPLAPYILRYLEGWLVAKPWTVTTKNEFIYFSLKNYWHWQSFWCMIATSGKLQPRKCSWQTIGEFKYYFESGKIKSIVQHETRERSYAWFYFENEQLMSEGQYVNQKKDSVWRNFNEQGFLVSIETFKNNRLNSR
jgi:hypothetical protein